MAPSYSPSRPLIKRIFLGGAAAVLIAAIWPAYNVGIVMGMWPPLTRPSGVPSSAHYVSAVEDEAWFYCFVDRIRDVDLCSAWDGYGRVLIDNGAFRLEDEDRAANEVELRPSMVIRGNGNLSSFIYLFGHRTFFGRLLVPVDAHNKRILPALPPVSIPPGKPSPGHK